MVRTSLLRRTAEVASNVQRLPGPPVYIYIYILYFFVGDGKPPWLEGPKAHSPHDTRFEFGRSKQW